MSAPLAILRSRLNRLRVKRRAVRWGVAAATVAALVLTLLIALFAVDFLADLNRAQRLVVIVATVVAGFFTLRRFVWPWLAVRESEIDVALLVDRQQRLEGDLVAALQFIRPEAARWGSPQLEHAVVGYVDEAARELPLADAFTWRPLPRRTVIAGGLLIAVVAGIVLFPVHAWVFFERLTLVQTQYPTRTVITSLAINGVDVDLRDTITLRAPAGEPLRFAVAAKGELPAAGAVQIRGDSGAETELPLQVPRGSAAAHTPYAATLDSFTESVTFTVSLGDAVTPARQISVVPLPAVAIDLRPTPPAYARSAAPPAPPAGTRTAFVLQGSDIEIVVRGVNKPLATVELIAGQQTLPAKPSADGRTWTIAPTGPLQNLAEPIAFTLNVVDADGLKPAQPISGSIRLRPDRSPRVMAAAAVRRVIPTGTPELTYAATDDFGIKAVRAKIAIQRADGRNEQRTLPLSVGSQKSVAEVQGRLPLEMVGLNLNKGDQVTIIVEAEDARGDRPGQVAAAEPVTFDVTDREGLLAGLLEADEEGATRLDAIIQRELGLGAGR